VKYSGSGNLTSFEAASTLCIADNFGQSRLRTLSQLRAGSSGQPRNMQILCEVNQAECFRRGIDAPKSTIKLEVNPAKLPEDLRAFVADHLYDGYKLSLGEGIPGSDLLAFMEAILANQEFKKADPTGWATDFNSWIKGDGKESAGERLEKAKELAQAQGDVLPGDVKKQKVAQAALSQYEASKNDKETREEQYERRMSERVEQEKLSNEQLFGSKKK
jgi:hypothetical protein